MATAETHLDSPPWGAAVRDSSAMRSVAPWSLWKAMRWRSIGAVPGTGAWSPSVLGAASGYTSACLTAGTEVGSLTPRGGGGGAVGAPVQRLLNRQPERGPLTVRAQHDAFHTYTVNEKEQ